MENILIHDINAESLQGNTEVFLRCSYWTAAIIGKQGSHYPMQAYYDPIIECGIKLLEGNSQQDYLVKPVCIGVLKKVYLFFEYFSKYIAHNDADYFLNSEKQCEMVCKYTKFLISGNLSENTKANSGDLSHNIIIIRENNQLMSLIRMINYFFEEFLAQYFVIINKSCNGYYDQADHEKKKKITSIYSDLKDCYDAMSGIIVYCGDILNSALQHNQSNNNNNNNNNNVNIHSTRNDIKLFESSMNEILHSESQNQSPNNNKHFFKKYHSEFFELLIKLIKCDVYQVGGIYKELRGKAYNMGVGCHNVVTDLLDVVVKNQNPS